MEEVFLHNPTFLKLDDAYRSLPILKSVQVKSSNYEQTVQDLEKIGFVAIEIISYSPEKPNQTIRAYKGKHGPCYFTGKKVRYSGTALVALDDDNHLLVKNESMEVCDKTYNILSLNPYQGLVYGESDFQDRSVDDDVKSDFESTQGRLYDQLKNISERSSRRKVLFYPGPFRLLILADGAMIYRGSWCNISADQSRELIEKEGCIESMKEIEGRTAYFQEEYSKSGSAYLMKHFEPETIRQPENKTVFSKLSGLSKKFRQRLLDVIENQRKYFILIGNEMEDKLGCCPSVEVTEANRLVKYGILSSLSEPVQGDSCPVTLYAFKDELSISEHGFSSKINMDFRNNVAKVLRNSFQSAIMNVLKWVLLVFIVISLGIAARKCQSLQTAKVNESLYEQLDPASQDQFMLLLFHNQKRCYQCEQMEKNTLDVFDATGSMEFEGLVFKTVIIDDPKNQNIVSRFEIFAPTLVMLEFNQKELVKSKVLLKLTGMYREEETFKSQLSTEIHQFMTKENE